MILNTTWYDGVYEPEGEPGTGSHFFLGGAALSEDSPVFVIGAVETDEGWLLFAANFTCLPVCVSSKKSTMPQSVAEAREFYGDNRDLVMGAILADAPGWEWDIVQNALTDATGLLTLTVPPLSKDEAKAAVHRWLVRMGSHAAVHSTREGTSSG